MKNLLNSVMLFLLLFIGQNAWGQEVLASGDLTSTITWSVEQTGTDSYTLNITGYGDMPDYSGLKDMPWAKCQSAYGVTTNYNSMITELNIDSRITKIGRRTFVKAESITSVTIPANCVSIGQEAFKYCSNLKEIYIPSSVTSIGTDAFSNCRSLDLIHYDGRCNANTGIAFSNVAAAGKIIEKSGTGASYANVPEGWEYYTHGEQCTRKAWVAENASGDKLFIYGQNPGARVNYAASGAVYNTDSPEYHPWRVNCWKYKSLEINRNVSVIESNELCGYSDNGVGKEGFASLETITVESGNESFVVGEDGALYNAAMTSIRLYPVTNTATHIDIPSTITSIGSGAFYATKNLESVTFHANSLYFGQYSFARTSLNFIYFDTSQAPLSWSATSFTGVAEEGVVAANGETNAFKNFTSMIGSGWTFDGETYGPVKSYISDGTLYVVGKGEYTTSSSNADWYSQRSSIKKILVKEGITNIGGEAFAYCSNVTEVTLNNTGAIRYYAFKDCSELVRVNIGSGVTEFNPYANGSPFPGCSKLSTINVTDLKAFCSILGLERLTCSSYGTAESKTLLINGAAHSSTSELVIPENVSSISSYAFRYFSNVTKIKLPSSLKTILDNNFYGHTYLTEITVPATVSNIGASAFSGCTSLQTAILNNNGDIGASAFSGCTSLQTVTLNNNGNISEKAFYGCKSLQTATLNNKGNIGGSAFEGCTSLHTVTLNNTGAIRYYAFKDCSELVRVNIGSGVTEFNPYANGSPFPGCSKLSTINVTDLKAFCSILGLERLTCSSYGTAESKTLLINGAAHSSTSELVIPENVSSISSYAFRYFSNVTKIKLPSSLKTILDNNFYGHTYLTEITIPSTVSSVGKSAFGGCTNLKRIVCLAPTCPSTSGSIATEPGNITLKVPRGTASQYKADSYWKDFKIEECRYEVEDMDIYKYGTLTSNGYVIASLYSDYKVKSWSSTDTDIATAIYDTQYAARVYAKDYVYDGSTAKPYKEFTIIADLGDCDTCVWNIRLYPREVELIDGNAYKNTEDFSINGKISYTRTYTEKYKNHLQCFYVPFDVEVTDELLEGYTFYELYMVSQDDTNGNGEIEDDEPLMMYLNRVPAGRTLYANMPYYIKAKEVSTLTVTAENATLHAATNGSVSCSTTKNEYTLTGINESTNVKGLYTMSAKGNFSHYTKDTYIGSFRWYMSIRDRRAKGAEYENYARPIQIVIDGEEETTGIANLDDKASAPQNDKVFTLDGRQVNNTDNLPSGMYIVNGKKVVKK